jgi:hypothetical protein
MNIADTLSTTSALCFTFSTHPYHGRCTRIKKRLDGAGQDTLCFTCMETALTEHELTLERLKSAVGLIQAHASLLTL